MFRTSFRCVIIFIFQQQYTFDILYHNKVTREKIFVCILYVLVELAGICKRTMIMRLVPRVIELGRPALCKSAGAVLPSMTSKVKPWMPCVAVTSVRSLEINESIRYH